jgi:hypothetical protein
VTEVANREVIEPSAVLNPVDIERRITDTVDRIAKGVGIVTDREAAAREKRREFDRAYALAYKESEGMPAHMRRYEADLLTMTEREAADDAEIKFRHAERNAKALEKELLAWQSVLNSVRAMYGAAGVTR